MKVRGLALCAALCGLGAISAPALAQDVGAAGDKADSICAFHGEDCFAPPSDWKWERLEPRIGVYSVELPCDSRQADSFGVLMALTPGQFQAGATRACMKAAAAFTASLIGFVELPDGARPPEIDDLLQGEPDMFSALVKQVTRDEEVPQTTILGRRAIVNIVEKPTGHSKVAIIEVSQFGVLMIIGDIRTRLEVSREEGDALIERFFSSLEFSQ